MMRTRNQPARLALLADWIDENKLRLPDEAPWITVKPHGGTELVWHMTGRDDLAREALDRITESFGRGVAHEKPGILSNWSRWWPADAPDLVVHYSAAVARERELNARYEGVAR